MNLHDVEPLVDEKYVSEEDLDQEARRYGPLLTLEGLRALLRRLKS
jgi:hypothetical protein